MDVNMAIENEESSEMKMKQMKDFSNVVKEEVPKVTTEVLAKPTLENLNLGLEKLLALEKKTRLAMDVPSTVVVAKAIVQLCFDAKHFPQLNEHIMLLSKRRAQLQKVIKVIIITAYGFIDQMPDDESKRALLKVLRTVSAGKMFVELELARMTRTLASMEEKEGHLTEAADLLNEIQVETIGSMEVLEKADLLLEQIRLCLLRKDYVRVEILTRKMKPQTLEDEKMQHLKIKHYTLSVEYYDHVNNYLEICRAYQKIFMTPSIQKEEALWRKNLTNAVIFCLLATYGAESKDIMLRLKHSKQLEELPVMLELVGDFTTDELMVWPLKREAEVRACDVFTDMEKGEERFNDLHKRVIQHNLRICSLYYSEIRTEHLATLLQLSMEEMEKALSEMVSTKQLFAKVDRPAGIISFVPRENAQDVLKTWSADVDKVLNLIEQTCHLIDKEMTMGKITKKQEVAL